MPDADAGRIADSARGLHVYADGCYEPHGRTGGWAFVVYRDGAEIASELGRVDGLSNNAMELTALLKAARWIGAHAGGEPCMLWADSVYAVNGCNQWRPIWKNWGWRKKGASSSGRNRPIADRDLWMAVDAALSASPDLTIAWCKGHSGIPGNERADMLAEHGRRSPGP